MSAKMNRGLSAALRWAAAVLGAMILALGIMGLTGGVKKIFTSMGMKALGKTLDKWPVWQHFLVAAIGFVIIAFVLNTLESKGRNSGAHSSKLLRRPLQNCFVIFLLPTLGAFCVGFLYPFMKGMFLSFCSFKTTSKWSWVGFQNYAKAIGDESFMYSFGYTAMFAIVSLVVINVLAFAVAYALTQKIKGSNIFRTVFFMPNLIGGIVLGYIWSMIFDGILSQFGTSLLLEKEYGFWGLLILMCWQQIGYMMIIYIAGLQAVPEDMLEAARIDGANQWQTLWKVTIPNVMPSITICTFLTLTNSFKLYDQNLALTAGRPFIQNPDGTVLKTTEMLALNIVNSFYSSGTGNRGVGQAKAVLFFVLVAFIGLIQLRATRNKEVQQ